MHLEPKQHFIIFVRLSKHLQRIYENVTLIFFPFVVFLRPYFTAMFDVGNSSALWPSCT